MVRWLAAALTLLGLAACEQPDPDTIVFAVATPPGVLDPRLAADAASERINALLYKSLTDLDEQGRAVPAMADWQMLSPRHYRFHLREDRAPFWNGELPTSNDVVATYTSLLDPALGSPHAGGLSHIARIRATTETAVEFELSRPDSAFPGRLAVGIIPASLSDQGSLSRAPMGSGTFEFMRWREHGGCDLRRRRDGQRVAIEPVADPTMRALKLMRGEAHLVQNDLPSELYAYLEERPTIQIEERPGTTFAYVGFNLADPVLADRRVRAAIAHAIDRDAIVRFLFRDRARKAESLLRPAHWAAAGDLRPYAHDPAEARRLLATAGYSAKRPLVLSYKTSTDPFRLRIAAVFKDQLAKVGIALKIASYDWGTFFGDIKAGRFQLYSLAWVGVNTPDILRYAFHSTSLPPGGANRGRYRSDAVDRLLDSATQSDEKTAVPLYREAQQLIHDDIVYVPLWYEDNVSVSRDIVDYRPGFDGNYLALNRVQLTGEVNESTRH